ncbi:hypothetical protein HN385_00335 [archaeon]|jgi:hypothetical protein|nr:hypothetical protein [archaeon]MBT3451629.1 hypothetical protein [archaeon]MBT6869650.1 hypothetical protein [archaeon]MBT7192418.1 hypothetical protein [archaeon]MBT7380219.1 hypothetical protein [archaeon]
MERSLLSYQSNDSILVSSVENIVEEYLETKGELVFEPINPEFEFEARVYTIGYCAVVLTCGHGRISEEGENVYWFDVNLIGPNNYMLDLENKLKQHLPHNLNFLP